MGRGLAAILSVAPKDDAEEMRQLPVDLITPNPRQPRGSFDDEALALIERGELTEGHGRALLLAEDHAARRTLAREAAAAGWSVRDLENRARAASAGDRGSAKRASRARRRRNLHPDHEAAITQISDALGEALGCDVDVAP